MLAGSSALVPLLTPGGRARVRQIEAGRPLLGTWVRVVARHPDRELATRAIELAFAAIRDVDAQMSVHRPDSDLSRVNQAAGRGPVRVPHALLTVVGRALEFAARTQGVYDPTVLPLMRAYGFYGPPQSNAPTALQVDRANERTDWRGVQIDPVAGTIALAREGMGLDLGSIGKGWAVDCAVAALRAEGIESGLVDAGGNVYGLGAPEDEPEGWAVGVLHPATGRTEHVFHLRDSAVATSGNSERFVMLGTVRVGHLLDARNGMPSAGHLSVSAVARDGMDSDRISTAAFLTSPARMGDWPEALDVRYIG